jgi:CHAT domain-containing protein
VGALAAGGRAEVAFALAERRRARELRDRLVRAAALRSDGGAARRPTAPTDAAPNAVGVTVSDVATAIPDRHTALLEFVGGVSGAPTAVFVVQRAGLRTRVLPPTDSLPERISLFATLLESGADPRTLARTLGAAILDSALAVLDPAVTRLVVVPDGALHKLPFDGLRLADGHYAVERYAISLAPSAAVAAALWSERARHGSPSARPVRLLAFGDPTDATDASEYTARDDGARGGGSGAAETSRSAFDVAGALPRLRASADEARLVARYAPAAEVRLRERASATFLKHAPLDSFRVIHFATHALVDEASVARTALVLAPGGGESGFVGPGDLAALRLDADLVVLSACRTAGGVVVGGEGMQGLTAPLLAAGARSVVASRWNIGDRSTVTFAQDFYAALARGLPAGEALRAAKLAALRRGAPPRTWAGFTLVGDPFVRVPLRAPRPLSRWWAVAVTLGAGGALAYGVRMRRRHAAERR